MASDVVSGRGLRRQLALIPGARGRFDLGLDVWGVRTRAFGASRSACAPVLATFAAEASSYPEVLARTAC